MTPTRRPAATVATELPDAGRVLAVCAHPDDESFGLGAIIASFIDRGAAVDVLCLTRGDASTLGAGPDLAGRRIDELRCASGVLGIERTVIRRHPDGRLDEVPLDVLVADVLRVAADADVLLVYDHGGITGHPDHQRATDAVLAAAACSGVAVLAWAIPQRVAATLNDEFGTRFAGRVDGELDYRITVDRRTQLAACQCHGSQLIDNPVVHRRLALQGDGEALRELPHPQ